MDGDNEQDADRAYMETDYSAAEGDGDRRRYSTLARCASQWSLDESSQRAGGARPPPPAHAPRLLHALATLRQDRTLCDVELQAQAEGSSTVGEPIAAHRAVLAAASPYFLAMFTQFEERDRPSVLIRNVEPSALEAIIQYIYDPETLVITENNVQGLLAGASLVAVGGVRAQCCQFLAAALAADNALGIRAFAAHHACQDLAHAAARYIDMHFAQVIDSEEFLALDSDVLCQLLESDRITVPNEEVILDAVIKWMQHDPETRGEQLGAVLQQVRLPLLTQDALVTRAAAEPLASAQVEVKDLVIEALSFHLLRAEGRAAVAAQCRRARVRRGAAALGALLVAGGQAPKAISEAEVLHLPCGRWRSVAALPARRCRAGLARLDGLVYAVGGFNGSLRVRSVDVYDPAADAWAAGPALAARRSTLGVAALGGRVFAVGGFDGVSGLSSAEALRPADGAWRPIASMRSRRSSVGVAALAGRLYAVGGYDGASRQCLQTVECYDPDADVWTLVGSMAARRSGAGVAALGGALYACGGHDGPNVRSSVERLPLEGAGATGVWEPAPSMVTPRRNAAVVAHRGRLYAVGGDDGVTNLDTVEVFDPVSECWAVLPQRMAVGRSYAAVCVVDLPA